MLAKAPKKNLALKQDPIVALVNHSSRLPLWSQLLMVKTLGRAKPDVRLPGGTDTSANWLKRANVRTAKESPFPVWNPSDVSWYITLYSTCVAVLEPVVEAGRLV